MKLDLIRLVIGTTLVSTAYKLGKVHGHNECLDKMKTSIIEALVKEKRGA